MKLMNGNSTSLRAKRSNPANNASKAIQSLFSVIASITNVIANNVKQSSKQRKQSNSVIAHRHREYNQRHYEQSEAIQQTTQAKQSSHCSPSLRAKRSNPEKTQHIAHVITSNAI